MPLLSQIESELLTAFRDAADGRRREAAVPSEELLALVRAWTGSDRSTEALDRCVQSTFLAAWTAELRAAGAASRSVEENAAAVESLSQRMSRFAAEVSAAVRREHERARERLSAGRGGFRLPVVKAILAGHSAQPAALGYDLRQHHLAAVASGAGAQAALELLSSRVDATLLRVPVDGDVVWAWFGSRAPFDAARRRLMRQTPAPDRAQLALGDPALDVDGFRRSHGQALDAHQVALCDFPSFVEYDDVVLEILLLRLGAATTDFVARELGPLAADGSRPRRLRETLMAYFRASHNASAAAATLGVHEHTVSYRLKSIEKALGRNVPGRRAELELALRMFDLSQLAAKAPEARARERRRRLRAANAPARALAARPRAR